jgi:hypothetical protein
VLQNLANVRALHTGSDAVISAKGVVDGRILITYGEVGASLQAVAVRDLCDVPCCEATWVAVVSTSNVAFSAVQIPVEVELFTRVVLVDRLTTSLDIVHAVLDAVDGSGNRILGDSYRVAKAPTLEETTSVWFLISSLTCNLPAQQ